MTPDEFARLRIVLRDVAARRPRRRLRRLQPHHRERVVDLRRLADVLEGIERRHAA